MSSDYPEMGKLSIDQPEQGYRYSLDPILLSGFALLKPKETLLDLGCGVGVILLRMADSVADAKMTGVELQPPLAEMACRRYSRSSSATCGSWSSFSLRKSAGVMIWSSNG